MLVNAKIFHFNLKRISSSLLKHQTQNSLILKVFILLNVFRSLLEKNISLYLALNGLNFHCVADTINFQYFATL